MCCPHEKLHTIRDKVHPAPGKNLRKVLTDFPARHFMVC
jgi:hypothetical protein